MLTYAEFVAAYTAAFVALNKYTPNEVGSTLYVEQMAALADDYPEFLVTLEADEDAKAAQ